MIDGAWCRIARRGTVRRQLGWACGLGFWARCDDSWAGLKGTGTLMSGAPRPVRNALGSWAPLRGGVASRIV
eukprot:352901-Chlamydomonas_euryale.AAC.17